MDPAVGGAIDFSDSRLRVEIFTYLACLGPEAFDGPRAKCMLPGHAELIDELTDPARRDLASSRVGAALAATLAARGRDTTWAVGALLPSLLNLDTTLGFSVLRNVAASANPTLARDFGEVLLSLTLGEATLAGRSTDPAEQARGIARARYLLTVLGALDQDAAARSRLFLALTQGLSDPDLLREVVLGPMFPATPSEAVPVLLEGNEDALRALLAGAATRPQGKGEFYTACKAVMDLGVRAGLPALARLDRLLQAPDASVKALNSMVRASVLLALESAARNRDLRSALPEEADLPTLRLATLVAPGVQEPSRSVLCEYIVDQATARMRSGLHGLVPQMLVEVLVGASVLHQRPDTLGTVIRTGLLEVGGALRIRLQTGTVSVETAADVDAFERVIAAVGAEFRRRQNLASSLAGVLPLLSSLRAPVDAGVAAWAD